MVQHNSRRKTGGAQKKPPLTHFLCIPLVSPASRPQLQQALETFRDAICLPDSHDAGGGQGKEAAQPTVHPRAIRPIGTLHCTLGVMSLSEDQLAEAVAHLKSLDVSSMLRNTSIDRSSESPSLKVVLKGLTSMHALSKTSILYCAPSDSTNRLYPFCLALQQTFREKGFVVPDERALKLHVTIVNTIYVKGRKPGRAAKQTVEPPPKPTISILDSDEENNQRGERMEHRGPSQVSGLAEHQSGGHGPNAKAPLQIDATAIMRKFEDFVWAQDLKLDRIAICEMGAKKITDVNGDIIDERYTEVASVALP